MNGDTPERKYSAVRIVAIFLVACLPVELAVTGIVDAAVVPCGTPAAGFLLIPLALALAAGLFGIYRAVMSRANVLWLVGIFLLADLNILFSLWFCMGVLLHAYGVPSECLPPIHRGS